MSSPFECPICLNTFGGSENKPLIIPCGHTMCDECIELENQTIECPMCRQIFYDIKSLPTNYALITDSVEVGNFKKQKAIKILNSYIAEEKELGQILSLDFEEACDVNKETTRKLVEIKNSTITHIDKMIEQINRHNEQNRANYDFGLEELKSSIEVKKTIISEIESGLNLGISLEKADKAEVVDGSIAFKTETLNAKFSTEVLSFNSAK